MKNIGLWGCCIVVTGIQAVTEVSDVLCVCWHWHEHDAYCITKTIELILSKLAWGSPFKFFSQVNISVSLDWLWRIFRRLRKESVKMKKKQRTLKKLSCIKRVMSKHWLVLIKIMHSPYFGDITDFEAWTTTCKWREKIAVAREAVCYLTSLLNHLFLSH